MGWETILYEKRGPVGLLTLNRPERLNAWTRQMSGELVEAIAGANADPEVGAVVVTGAGKGFCAGADVRDAFQKSLDGDARAVRTEGPDWVSFVRESKPLLAAVNGVAVGVGLTLILPFDVVLASDRARFGMFFVRMGLVPELASTHWLVQRAGFGHASAMCLTGRAYPAEEAVAMGVADRLVPHAELLPIALTLAGEIAANADAPLRRIKQLLTANHAESDLAAAQRRELEHLARALASPEHREAVAAFQQKRPPVFR